MLKNKKFLPKIIIIAIVSVALIVAALFIIPSKVKSIRFKKLMDSANQYISELDYESAIECYKNAIKINPQSVEAYLSLADAYISTGDYKSALRTITHGLAFLPNNEELINKNSKVHTLSKSDESDDNLTLPELGTDTTNTEHSINVSEEIPEEQNQAENTFVPQYMYSINTTILYASDIDDNNKIKIENDGSEDSWYNYINYKTTFASKYWVNAIDDEYVYIQNENDQTYYIYDNSSSSYIEYTGNFYSSANQFVTETEYNIILDYISNVQEQSGIAVCDMYKLCIYDDFDSDEIKELFFAAFDPSQEYSGAMDEMYDTYNVYICCTNGDNISINNEFFCLDKDLTLNTFQVNSIKLVEVSGICQDWLEYLPSDNRYYYIDGMKLKQFESGNSLYITQFMNQAVMYEAINYYTNNVKFISPSGEVLYDYGGTNIYYPLFYLNNIFGERSSVIIDENQFMSIPGASEAVDAGKKAVMEINYLSYGGDWEHPLNGINASVENILYNDNGFFVINYLMDLSDNTSDFYIGQVRKIAMHAYAEYINDHLEIIDCGIGEQLSSSGKLPIISESDFSNFQY